MRRERGENRPPSPSPSSLSLTDLCSNSPLRSPPRLAPTPTPSPPLRYTLLLGSLQPPLPHFPHYHYALPCSSASPRKTASSSSRRPPRLPRTSRRRSSRPQSASTRTSSAGPTTSPTRTWGSRSGWLVTPTRPGGNRQGRREGGGAVRLGRVEWRDNKSLS